MGLLDRDRTLPRRAPLHRVPPSRKIDDEVRALAQGMLDVMYGNRLRPGRPQVGEMRQIVVIDV